MVRCINHYSASYTYFLTSKINESCVHIMSVFEFMYSVINKINNSNVLLSWRGLGLGLWCLTRKQIFMASFWNTSVYENLILNDKY
jgi:hypothetical protein